MGLTDFFRRHKGGRIQMQYAKMMQGYTPVFTSFGDDIYASDIVKNAVMRVAEEMSKLQPRHIITDSDGMQSVPKSELNYLFRFGPNPMMNTSDFLAKITFLREVRKNCYILPVFTLDANGNRCYSALYPLNPMNVDYLSDADGRLIISFQFAGEPQNRYQFPYDEIIHLRKNFAGNDFVGGEEDGSSSDKSLVRLLATDDVSLQAIDKGIRASNTILGIVKQNTMLDDEDLENKTKAFEEKIRNNTSGFLMMDLKNDFVQCRVDPKFVDKDVCEFIQKRILSAFGMSMQVYNGEFDEESYQAFYEAVLEPAIINFGREFTRVLLNRRQLNKGHEIVFYNESLQYMKTENKIQVATILGNMGTLTDNQLLAIFGYPPFEGGNIRHQSLNYINRDLVDEYQMMNAGRKVKEDDNGKKE